MKIIVAAFVAILVLTAIDEFAFGSRYRASVVKMIAHMKYATWFR